MTIPPKLNEIIYLDQRLQWEFSCAYSTSYEISNDMTVNSASIEDNFSASGQFAVSLRTVFTLPLKIKFLPRPFMLKP